MEVRRKQRWPRLLLTVVLAVVMAGAALCELAVPAEAASNLTLSQLQSKFPQGSYWNSGNPDTYTSSPCGSHANCDYYGNCGCTSFSNAIQCYGFALKLGYDAYGSNPRNWQTTTAKSYVDSLKPGDIVDSNSPYHTVFVTGVTATTVTIGECNYGGRCLIRWDRTLSKETIKGYGGLNIYIAPSTLSTSAPSAPTYATIKSDKAAYKVGETITFTVSTDGNVNDIWIYDSANNVTAGSPYAGIGNSLKISISKPGRYEALVQTWNGVGEKISSRIPFTVGPPVHSTIKSDKEEYKVGETITFTVSTYGNVNDIWIYDSANNVTAGSPYAGVGNSLKISISKPGKYEALVQTWNGVGEKISSRIPFTVGPPVHSTIKSDKEEYKVGETITFTVSTDGNVNDIWIYDSANNVTAGSPYAGIGNNLKISISTPGEYEALVQTWNGIGEKISNRIPFTVVANQSTVAVTGIKLNQSTATLTAGDALTLTATVTPSNATNKTVTWTTSNSSVAKVSGGKVTAVKEGKATITASCGERSASCVVTVKEKPTTIAVTEISLGRSQMSLTVGDRRLFTATITPSNATNKTVVWTSSDPKIATVNDGLVTAIKEGKATITATCGGHTAACEVTVTEKAPTVIVTGIKLNQTSATLTTGETLTLTATISPSNATNKAVRWATSDSEIATVGNDGKVTALKAGEVTIFATSSSAQTATCEVTVKDKQTAPFITTESLTKGRVGNSYQAALSASGSTPLTWSINVGALPNGLTLNASTGRISGTPTKAGTFTFTAAVKNAAGEVTKSFTITIDPKSAQSAGKEVHFDRVTVYHQGQFDDVPANQWYTPNVADAYEFGLMKGDSDTIFDPYGDVTVAEAITMAARIHSIYATGSESFQQTSGKWYQVYLDYAYQNGIISRAYYNSDVSQKATRAQFAEIFAASLPSDALSAINTISDNAIPDVKMSSSFAGSVYKLYRAGILTGSDLTGKFNSQTYITRAEAAAIVSRMAESGNRVTFSLAK